MSSRLAIVLIIALHAFGACAPTHAGARDAAASPEKAKELWQRARMNEASSALGVPLQPYTDPPLAGVVIKAVHINEVQERR